jgi:hypothetical protein
MIYVIKAKDRATKAVRLVCYFEDKKLANKLARKLNRATITVWAVTQLPEDFRSPISQEAEEAGAWEVLRELDPGAGPDLFNYEVEGVELGVDLQLPVSLNPIVNVDRFLRDLPEPPSGEPEPT